MGEEKGFFEKVGDKAKVIFEKVENKAKSVLNKTAIGRSLTEGNQMKEDLEQGKYEGLPNQHHADNYAHRYADAKIGQKGAAAAAVGYAIGVGKEVFDVSRKVLRGDNVKETLKDSMKDIKNNMEGLKWGYEHPNQDPHEWLAELDLDTNTFKKGYNNGIADAMKRDKQRAGSYERRKEEELLAQNKAAKSKNTQRRSALSTSPVKSSRNDRSNTH